METSLAYPNNPQWSLMCNSVCLRVFYLLLGCVAIYGDEYLFLSHSVLSQRKATSILREVAPHNFQQNLPHVYITNTEFFTNYILAPFCRRNFRLRGSINSTMREQLLFYRVVNWPADGSTYYSQQLQTSLSCEILRLYPRSSTYVYRICALFRADERSNNNRSRPDRTRSLRDSNPEYILLLKCHNNVAVFRICMITLRRLISCCSSRTNASLCSTLQPLLTAISRFYCTFTHRQSD